MAVGENENDVPEQQQEESSNRGSAGKKGWGANDSLKRNAGLNESTSAEDEPLLGNGSGNSSDPNESVTELEWEGLADFEGLPWWRKPSVTWLVPSFFLFALAFGGIIVPKLNLILSLVCRQYFIEKSSADSSFIISPILLDKDNPQCRIPEVQSLVTKFMLYITIITGCLSAVMSPKLGALSDRYGRIKILVISSIGAFSTEIITILAFTYPDTINYRWLLVGAVIDGLCGSFTAGMALTHAYASDCTPPPKRAVAFGYFHACLFSGIALGPLCVAFILRNSGTLITIFYIALGIHLFFMLFILICVPESLTKKRQMLARERFAAEGINLLTDGYTWIWALKQGNILAPLKILWPTGPRASSRLRANLILLSTVDTIIFGVAMGAVTVVVYYSGFQFDWDTEDTSYFISIVNIIRVCALVIVLPLLNYLIRTRRANKQRRESGFALPEPNSGSDSLDLSIIRVAVLCEVIGYAGYAMAQTGEWFIFAGVMAAIGGIGSPTLQSALTKHVPHDRVGQLLGATGLLHALARVVAPTIFNLIYAETVGSFPQAVFVVLSGSFGVAFVFSWFIRPNGLLHFPFTNKNC
ncbi:major facilitator superfamily domain-containing protein [Tricladium varicosporioides]|nr:major facilitator superfamily domain-containing protein [Hymenoscyphus varicosporioides]